MREGRSVIVLIFNIANAQRGYVRLLQFLPDKADLRPQTRPRALATLSLRRDSQKSQSRTFGVIVFVIGTKMLLKFGKKLVG